MKRHEDASLDAEERALAAQLRRLPPHGEPAPDLDARILAMARTANGGRRPAPWYRGLPGYASAAAVCVLAAGLAWQMWPAHVQRGEHATASTPVPPPPKPVAEASPAQEDTASVAADAGVADKSTAAMPAAPHEVLPPPQPPRPAPARMPPTPQPAIIPSANDVSSYAAPAPAAAAPALAPPPAPPAPPAPPPPSPVQSMDATPAAASAKGSVELREQPKPAPASAPAPVTVNAMRAKAAAATSADTENGYDARPPATVQDTSVRNDWLKRIRELMAQGDRDGARSSLQEYRTRYPDATIPADLQPLLATPPAKTP